jgi:hypothetical protein
MWSLLVADDIFIVLTRYCDDEFDPESSTATIGIDFKVSCLVYLSRPRGLLAIPKMPLATPCP